MRKYVETKKIEKKMFEATYGKKALDAVTDKWYVTMTDDFMSGWGMAEGKVNKLVLECDTLQEAESVERYARSRGEMRYISIRNTKPYYNTKKFYTSFKTKKDYPFWYEQG